MVYAFKASSRLRCDPQTAGEMCEKLEAEGNLSARALLDANRSPDAPLHNAFTWDDGEAAEKWRENEAGHIIRCLVVTREEVKEPIRQFVTVCRQGAEPRYQSIETVISDSTASNALLELALADLVAYSNKYKVLRHLARLEPVFDAIEEATA